ncbi:hypothetical protein D3C87_1430320 [compost metagenome]
MRRSSYASVPIVHLAGICLGTRHEVGQCPVRLVGTDFQNHRGATHETDAGEIFDQVVARRQAGLRQQRDGVGRRQNGVAIGGRILYVARAQQGIAARPVFYQDGLAQLFAHLLGHQARRQIERAAARGRHDDAHGLERVGIGRDCCACRPHDGEGGQSAGQRSGPIFDHACLLCLG